MGLGKTLQALATGVARVQQSGVRGHILVVAPLSTLNNWATEAARFFPTLPVVVFHGSRESRDEMLATELPAAGLVVTSYEMILGDGRRLAAAMDTVIAFFDEGHRLKSPTSRVAALYNAVFRSSSLIPSFILTGTPLQNNMAELYVLLHFVAPSQFPLTNVPSAKRTSDDSFAAPAALDDQTQPVASMPELDAFASLTAAEAQAAIAPVLLRRVRSQVLSELPPKTEYVLHTVLTDMQARYYRAILAKDASSLVASLNPSRTNAVRASLSSNVVMQLRKACNHPYLFEGAEPEPFEEGEHLVENAAKLTLLDKLLQALKPRGHRVLVFSQSARVLDILQDYLNMRKFSYERLDGSVRAEERYQALRAFCSDTSNTFVFLLSTRAGGVGLNLTQADTVIFYDSDWNPHMDLQAIARVHRMGQTAQVRVFRLVVRDTIDEVMVARATRKLALAEAVIGETGAENRPPATSLARFAAHGAAKVLAAVKADDEPSTIELAGLGEQELAALLDAGPQDELPPGAARIADAAGSSSAPAPSMYTFEGVDYAGVSTTSATDRDALAQLVANEAAASAGSRPRKRTSHKRKRTRSAHASWDYGDSDETYSDEEAEAVAAARARAVAKREAAAKRTAARWTKMRYASFSLLEPTEHSGPLDTTSDSDDELASRPDLHFVVGSVLEPQEVGNGGADEPAIVVACCDNSGKWPSRGLFSLFTRLARAPQNIYSWAASAKDLHLGDTLLVPLNEAAWRGSVATASDLYLQSPVELRLPGMVARSAALTTTFGARPVWAALVVGMQRPTPSALSRAPVLVMSALEQALVKLGRAASLLGATIHTPRVGARQAGFNWYGTERLLRKTLVRGAGRHVVVYYYARRRTAGRQPQQSRKVIAPQASPTPPPKLEQPGPSTNYLLPGLTRGDVVHTRFATMSGTMRASIVVPRGEGSVVGKSPATLPQPRPGGRHVVLVPNAATPTESDEAVTFAASLDPPGVVVTEAWLA
ncbi:SNF2 family DNA-dependent ATPase [Thecamonas trahens ATCC 50062]|uniref:SNF2 family DNA-dependent ATPase n=1 Tax=Thecamonas trahens ATCC 50062 TaxID=461836 RepID=A0A0L0D542_THETB|nr:SNF2 family DNA-dependent ATPase [Thecamonas trahens ATCC 50062]KNC46418.1 SNF2 family DNA-dependent ATPase [Thecamonas trahens ATCC 50062]|eukprot:XP_013760709.1 SNF2 family DNA-dependent ATPase [Thecamonas trahens ATCC 50062]